MTPNLGPPVQDTAFVMVARDGLGLGSAWLTAGICVALALLLIGMFLALMELRRLSRAWTGFLNTTSERALPIVEHARGAAESLEHIAGVARSQVDRLDESLGSATDHITDGALEVRRRLADLSALLDVAQSEAEEGVLDIAAKVRALRSAAGLLPWPAGTDNPSAPVEDNGLDENNG